MYEPYTRCYSAVITALCGRKKQRGNPKRKENKMTLKEAIKEVVSNRPSLYPNGWDTEIGKILQNTVQDFCIEKLRRVWELMIRTPYNGEAPTTSLFVDYDDAKGAMEEDIEETLASKSPRFYAEDLVRQDDDNARIGDEIFWEIEQKDLNY